MRKELAKWINHRARKGADQCSCTCPSGRSGGRLKVVQGDFRPAQQLGYECSARLVRCTALVDGTHAADRECGSAKEECAPHGPGAN